MEKTEKFYKIPLNKFLNIDKFTIFKNGEQIETDSIYFKIPTLKNLTEEDTKTFLKMGDLYTKKLYEYQEKALKENSEEKIDEEMSKATEKEQNEAEVLFNSSLLLGPLGIEMYDVLKLVGGIKNRYIFLDEELQVPAFMFEKFISSIKLNEEVKIFSFLFVSSLKI